MNYCRQCGKGISIVDDPLGTAEYCFSCQKKNEALRLASQHDPLDQPDHRKPKTPVPMPKFIDIGPYRYTVITDQSAFDRKKLEYGYDDSTRGWQCENDLEIHIDSLIPVALQRMVLLHEVTHAVHTAVGVNNKDSLTEEEYVTREAPLMLDTLRRNPEVVAFLLGDE